ncbi:hypothetical protein WT03_06875 [Burkholderia stagnalis]|nr:hypothetical protein WT03_06875 [Burkholderia stagnalis]
MNAFMKFKEINWKELPIADRAVTEHGNVDDQIHYVLSNNNTGLLLKDYAPRFIDTVLKDSDYIRVAIFRDPVDRIVSACNHFFIQESDNPVALRHARQLTESFNCLPNEGCITDRQEQWLRRLVKFISQTNTSTLDPHWIPQYSYISELKIDYILPLERLDVLEHLVTTRSGKKLVIGRSNVRRDLMQSNTPALNSELRQLIEELYWIDRDMYEKAKAKASSLWPEAPRI